MKNFRPSLFLAVILCMLFPFSIMAQWSNNAAVNNLICGLSGEQSLPKIATCPNGDSYIGYFSSESGNYNVRLQKLNAQGYVQWAADGILISNNPQNSWLTDWDMTADNANHCILVFPDIRSSGNTNVVAYRISPSGSFVWGANGIMLSNTSAFNAAPKVVTTPTGNTVVAWTADDDIIMQKISPSGSLLWGTTGILHSAAPDRLTWPQLITAGTDDVIMKYFYDTGPVYPPTRHVYAQRYNSSGASVWTSPSAISVAGGISAWTQIFPFYNDGSDGFYICWNDDRDNNLRSSVFVQHVNSSGIPQWTTNGVEVTSAASMNHYYPQMAFPPGSQDVYVFWNEMTGDQNQWGLYGQKVNSSGALQWGPTGMVFIPVSLQNVYPIAARSSPSDVVLFYEEYFNSINTSLKAMRISSTGSYLWSPSTRTLCSVNSEKLHTEVNEFADNQWIASWGDDRNPSVDVYAQNIQLNGDLGPYNPTYGTIAGTVTLNGGSGNVTQVVVQAGSTTTNPDALGHYSMTVATGTYTVTASLAGYTTGSQSNVVVQTSQTTTVNFILNHIPAGFIQGTVTLVNGPGNVTMVQVSAGSQWTNPDATGHYSLQVTPGTYNVIATLAGYIPDTVFGVTVADGQTVSNIDLSLSLAPTNGFITGTVTLSSGSGIVTQTVVSAGGYTTNPNSAGFYTLDIPAGFYDVNATLAGYIPQTITGVQVLVGQTTPNINFLLDPNSTAGSIQGHVTLTGGSANITEANVTAGTYSTHPDAAGNYMLTVPAGTYSVTASHPYTTSQTINNVIVIMAQNTLGIDFTLTVNRSDMVCTAVSNLGPGFLNNVDVVIQGPEGPYTGTIVNDSLVFPHVPFGFYSGSATYLGNGPYLSDTTIDASNRQLVFTILIDRIPEKNPEFGFSVNPNPAGRESMIFFGIPAEGKCTFEVFDATGRRIADPQCRHFSSGDHRLPLSSLVCDGMKPNRMYILRLTAEYGYTRNCKLVFSGN